MDGMKAINQSITRKKPGRPYSAGQFRLWLVCVLWTAAVLFCGIGRALAFEYEYRFENIAVSENVGDALFSFEITRVTDPVTGLPAPDNQIQGSDHIALRFWTEDGSAVDDSDHKLRVAGFPEKSITLVRPDTRVEITVPIIDDAIAESVETFSLRFEILSASGSLHYAGSGNPFESTATITDNDVKVVFNTDGNGTLLDEFETPPKAVYSLVQNLIIGGSTQPVTSIPNTSPLRYRFDHWTVSDGVKSIDVFYPGMIVGDVRTNLTITAVFAPLQHEITYQAGAGGYLNGNQNTITQMVDDTFDSLPVTADPEPGYRFAGWRILAGDTNAGPIDTNMASLAIPDVIGPVSVEALFEQIEYTLDISILSPTGPAFTDSKVIIEPELSHYHYGDVVVLTAVAGTGAHFSEWTGTSAGLISDATASSDTITVKSDITLSAAFIKKIVTLTMMTDGTGAGSTLPAGSETGIQHTLAWGDRPSISTTPEITSEFASWSGKVLNGQIEMIGDQTVTATFNLKVLSVNRIGRSQWHPQGS